MSVRLHPAAVREAREARRDALNSNGGLYVFNRVVATAITRQANS